ILHLSTKIENIAWNNNEVKATSADSIFISSKAIITVPISLIAKRGALSFTPEIALARDAANQLGYGGVIKFILQFDDAFWKGDAAKKVAGKSLQNLSFLFSDAAIPTWWTQYPNEWPILTG